VASILSAAEEAADRIRSETESRARDRIAEGQRAAENRVRAAEEEAAELLATARTEADRIQREARQRGEEAKTMATNEALSVVAKAQQSADETLTEAREAAARTHEELERESREVLAEARATAQEVESEGLELVANLRQMGDSLRANAERILRDVQGVHSRMVARIDQAEGNGRDAPATRRPRSAGGRETARSAFDSQTDGEIDVPEFIPPR
jgi:vacuolar-type H+-ATPase subunit H